MPKFAVLVCAAFGLALVVFVAGAPKEGGGEFVGAIGSSQGFLRLQTRI